MTSLENRNLKLALGKFFDLPRRLHTLPSNSSASSSPEFHTKRFKSFKAQPEPFIHSHSHQPHAAPTPLFSSLTQCLLSLASSSPCSTSPFAEFLWLNPRPLTTSGPLCKSSSCPSKSRPPLTCSNTPTKMMTRFRYVLTFSYSTAFQLTNFFSCYFAVDH